MQVLALAENGCVEVTPENVTALVPVFVTVTVCAAEVLPTEVLGKAKDETAFPFEAKLRLKGVGAGAGVPGKIDQPLEDVSLSGGTGVARTVPICTTEAGLPATLTVSAPLLATKIVRLAGSVP